MEKGEDKKEEGLKVHTVVFMIAVAAFFDVLQLLLSFVYLGWAAGIIAGLTFYLWFKFHGISFMRPKRFMAMGGASMVEMIPIPFLAAFPGWTIAVSYLALSKKIQEVIPGADVIKLDIMKK
jgi:hypothetical protein